MHLIKFDRRISRPMLWPPRSREQVARVAPIPRIKFQCFQTLEEGGYNEHVVATPRKARSAALFDRQTRPSSRKRVNAAQRLSR